MKKRITILLAFITLLAGNGCGSRDTGIASYYSNNLVGRKTAGGEVYRKDAMTAAHRTIPFGTRVKVTNLKNSKSVVVTINDRGPHVKGRIIDLSYAAAKKIGMIEDGEAKVKIEELGDKS